MMELPELFSWHMAVTLAFFLWRSRRGNLIRAAAEALCVIRCKGVRHG